jgi:REP element-mobilizing transposase RayT
VLSPTSILRSERKPCTIFHRDDSLEWKHLLKQEKYKLIITDSLAFLAANKRIKVYGFVIMPNHLHLLWHINDDLKRADVQRDFLKYTAQQIQI